VTRLTILICALAPVLAAAGLAAQASGEQGQSLARAARIVNLVERASLKLVSEKGVEITEHGQATGTYNGSVTASFSIRPSSITAVVTIYPRGGSITGTVHANYVIVKSLGYFGGTFTLGRGTGRFSHASEINHKALGVSGIINRYSYATEVKAHGEVRL
jgi:hypothetical protein